MTLTRKTPMKRGTSTLARPPVGRTARQAGIEAARQPNYFERLGIIPPAAPRKPMDAAAKLRKNARAVQAAALPRKPMKAGRRPAHTKAEAAYLGAVAAAGCVVCVRVLALPAYDCEVHHQRAGTGGGQRASHYRTIGLCAIHHRTGGHGVALHAGQETWEANFGAEVDHVERTRAELQKLIPEGM